jgi:predicted ATPase
MSDGILRLGITGPHSSGKTTLLEALRQTPEFQSVDFLPEITRTIKEQGYDINEAGTLDTQILIMSAHMQNLLTHKRFIVDRCLIDGLCYSQFLQLNPTSNQEQKGGQISQWFMDYCENLLESYLPYYTKIFYIPPELPVIGDGVRSTDTRFHAEIVNLFDENIQWYSSCNPNLIVTVRGSVEERVATVLDTVRYVDSSLTLKSKISPTPGICPMFTP